MVGHGIEMKPFLIFFDRLHNEQFLEQFENVVFYGASMGGYGASVFSAAAPGSKVIMISPQATIDPKKVPWENRYPKAKNQPFDGRYSYGPEMLKPVVLGCVEGTITKKSFYHMLRARKDNPRYRREMLTRLEKSGRDKLVVQ